MTFEIGCDYRSGDKGGVLGVHPAGHEGAGRELEQTLGSEPRTHLTEAKNEVKTSNLSAL
jgi:hypothetical protein